MTPASHKNYQLGGSVFVRQYRDRLVIESPGGFPNGFSLENILDRRVPRSRRIAEILSLCGLVERSGQGMNLIYELSIKEAKQLPDFSGTDADFVSITLHGLIIDTKMLSLINQIGNERLETLSTADFLVINTLYHGLDLTANLKPHRAEKIPIPLDIPTLLRMSQLDLARILTENIVKNGYFQDIATGRNAAFTTGRSSWGLLYLIFA